MKVPAFCNVGRCIREYDLASGQTFLEGAAVVLANGEVSECSADPATVLGFALHDAGADPFNTKILVAVAKAHSTFFIEGDRAPTAADIGDVYGIAKDVDGIWHLDTTDTSNTRVEVVDVDLVRGLFEVEILAANRQFA